MAEMAFRLFTLFFLCCGTSVGHPETGMHPPVNSASEQNESPAPGVRHGHHWAGHRNIRQEEPTPFIEVIPWVLSEGRRKPLQEALKDGHPSHLFVALEIEGAQHEMELKQNQELLRGGHSLVSYLPDGVPVVESAEKPVNCYYHLRVRGLPHSWGSVSTCSGIRGHIFLSGNRSYSITPTLGAPSGKHHITKIQDNHRNMQTCSGSYGQPAMPSEGHRPRPRRLRRNVLSEKKYIELVIVADKAEYKIYNSNIKKLQFRMLEIANQLDAFYQSLNVRVALVGLEVWNQGDQIPVDRNPKETLNRFLAWRQTTLLPRMHHDNAQLLTGVAFESSSVGMASQASMCTPERSGAVNVDHSVSILSVASTMAHELGHNLGISHDTDNRKCVCPRSLLVRSCIMESASGFLSGLAFSSCSKMDLELSLRQGVGMCLFNIPEPKNFQRQSCGNLFVEVGEECDCGLTEECKDPCCNATTCKLVPGAECSSDGICCKDCRLKLSGSMCREPLGECDLPEYCSGQSPYCPPNVYLQNGQPCRSGRAYCYSGDCRSYDSQCQALWGSGSSQAPDACFSAVNGKGDKYGNCGQGPNGSFLPCEQRDTKCGKIQCHGGHDSPLLGSKAEITVTNVTVNRTEFQCRGTYFNLGEDVTDPAMVMTGTACGEGKVCLNQKCQDVSALRVQDCIHKCNGHGVCNSNGHCHCEDGWAPPDCKSAGYGGSIDSGPLEQQKDPSTLTTALLVLFLLVLPLIALLIFCYVKRTVLQKVLGNFSKGTSCRRSDELAETQVRFLGEGAASNKNWHPQSGSRQPPERPRPPQRTQSTELQVMPVNSKPSFQGSDRPDPPSKPLPPDPVPKRVQDADPDRPAAPTRPLPADPVVKKSQPQVPAKPLPPPKKALPFGPTFQTDGELPSSVPSYHPQVMAFPSRPAPPPPATLSEDPHVQMT
ncbi:hypothetical protein NDU88_000906 [Pleurodeles waltl]|uniref:Disintegrin and metalloproteinase domain-containing protein 15 n=1 Tax=Pleurodeles waltl TaxID=8319 RepID=A0AAV7KNW5_PLEWA|nr:hypothetical protein NDU88_000906 [Pleurodeles waltl]